MIGWEEIGKLWVILIGVTLVFEMYKKIMEKIKN